MTVDIVQYGLKSLHIFEITSATVPTYATGAQATCARNLTYSRRASEAILEGDDTICFASRTAKGVDFTIEFGGVPLTHVALLEGATLTEIAGPPVESHVAWKVTDAPGDVGFIGVIMGKGGGNAHICVHNARITGGGPESAKLDEFGMSTYTGIGLPSAADSLTFLSIRYFATITAISTTWLTNTVTDVTP